MTSNADDFVNEQLRGARAELEEFLLSRDVQPIRSVEDLARPGVFETDAELDEFIAFTYAERQRGHA